MASISETGLHETEVRAKTETKKAPEDAAEALFGPGTQVAKPTEKERPLARINPDNQTVAPNSKESNQTQTIEGEVLPPIEELTVQFEEIGQGSSELSFAEQQQVFRDILRGRSMTQAIEEETEAGNQKLVELLEQAQETAEKVAEEKRQLFNKLNAARNKLGITEQSGQAQNEQISQLEREIGPDEIQEMARQLQEQQGLMLTTSKNEEAIAEQVEEQGEQSIEQAGNNENDSLVIDKFWAMAMFFAIDLALNKGRGMRALVGSLSYVVADKGSELILVKLGIPVSEEKLDQYGIDYFVGTSTAKEFLAYTQELDAKDLLISLKKIKPKTRDRLFNGQKTFDGYTPEETAKLREVIVKKLLPSQIRELARELDLSEDLTPKQNDQE